MASVALRPAVGTVVLAGSGVSGLVTQFSGIGAAPLSAPDAGGGRLYPSASLFPSATVWPGVSGLPAINTVGAVVFADRIGVIALAPSTATVALQTTT